MTNSSLKAPPLLPPLSAEFQADSRSFVLVPDLQWCRGEQTRSSIAADFHASNFETSKRLNGPSQTRLGAETTNTGNPNLPQRKHRDRGQRARNEMNVRKVAENYTMFWYLTLKSLQAFPSFLHLVFRLWDHRARSNNTKNSFSHMSCMKEGTLYAYLAFYKGIQWLESILLSCGVSISNLVILISS